MNREAEKDMAQDVEENPELYQALADDEVRYRRYVHRLDGSQIPANACFYCYSTDGPFVEWGTHRFIKCKGGCE